MRNDREKDKMENEYYFSIITKKYDAMLNEKDKEISFLKQQIELLKNGQKMLSNKKESISKALISAVDKANEIENSSKQVYEHKIHQLNILYSKWEKLLEEMLEKHPDLVETEKVAHMVKEFKKKIIQSISEDVDIKVLEKKDDDPFRFLLNKMNIHNDIYQSQINKKEPEHFEIERLKDKEPDIIPVSFVEDNTKTEKTDVEENIVPQAVITEIKLPEKNAKKPEKEKPHKVRQEKPIFPDDKPTKIKPIVDMQLGGGDDFETLADKFLNDDEELETGSGLSKAIFSRTFDNDPYAFPDANESGFNLEEAINPKDDLEQIMKAFDFYDEDKK